MAENVKSICIEYHSTDIHQIQPPLTTTPYNILDTPVIMFTTYRRDTELIASWNCELELRISYNTIGKMSR